MRWPLYCVLSVSFACLASHASAMDMATDVQWINFSGWDHGVVSSTGQTFSDIYDNVDVFVSVAGSSIDPTDTIAGGKGLGSHNMIAGDRSFEFTFSEPLPLVIRYQSSDDQEFFDVMANTIVSHTHTNGALPDILNIAGGQRVAGTSRRMTDDGASRGYFILSPTDHLGIVHNALTTNKHEGFRVGVLLTPVPEPASGALSLFAILGAWTAIRRRQR